MIFERIYYFKESSCLFNWYFISFINPKYDQYIEVSDKYNEVLEEYYDKEITVEEFTERTQDLSYSLNKNGYVYIIGDVVIAFLYFGVFAYFTNGQTLGKKLMKLKIVSNKEGKELKIYNYFIRLFILNGVILRIITFIAIWFNKGTYYSIYNFGSNFSTLLELVIFLMILFNQEGRGLHDILAGTKVIDLKDNNDLDGLRNTILDYLDKKLQKEYEDYEFIY